MIAILKKADEERQRKGGRKRKIGVENCLLLTLEYLREYRTYLHISVDYGLSKSQAQRTHRWVEETLIKDINKEIKYPTKHTEWMDVGNSS